MTSSSQTGRPPLTILLFLLLFFLPAGPGPGHTQPLPGETAISRPAAAGRGSELWQAAEQALQAGNKAKAGELFARYHQQHGQAERAEEALWQAARLQHELALHEENADWERVRDLYRLFVAEYPESPRFQDAYLGLGLAHFHMHFYREALIYFKLFLDRFPESLLRSEAKYWQGLTLVEIGRTSEAEKIYQELAAGADQHFRPKALEALGNLFFATDRFHGALAYYQELMKNITPYSPEHFDLIRRIGLTQARLGHEIASRDHLYRYLNGVEDSPHTAAVFFELAETYWRRGEVATARVLYDRALAEAGQQERPAVLSRFRLALYRAWQARELPPWQRNEDDLTADGDAPYQAVLDGYPRERIAQEARFALLQRFMGRMEFAAAFLLAKNYLNQAAPEDSHQQEVETVLGELLVARVERLLAEGEHRQVVALFQDENRHVLAYRQGKLLHLVGQAMETLGLHGQAAEVYFQAMSRELAAPEKVDLYSRRMNVYLAQEDLAAAERLLTHLHDLYQGQEEMAEVYHLNGRLLEAQGRGAEALTFHEESCRLLPPEKKSAACESRVRLLLQMERLQEAEDALAGLRRGDGLEAGARSQLHAELGDAWRRQGAPERAAAAYIFALGKDLPPNSIEAQRLHLRLADMYLQLGQSRKAVDQYQRALAGPDDLLRKIAEKGARQAGIDQSLAELQSLSRGDGAGDR